MFSSIKISSFIGFLNTFWHDLLMPYYHVSTKRCISVETHFEILYIYIYIALIYFCCVLNICQLSSRHPGVSTRQCRPNTNHQRQTQHLANHRQNRCRSERHLVAEVVVQRSRWVEANCRHRSLRMRAVANVKSQPCYTCYAKDTCNVTSQHGGQQIVCLGCKTSISVLHNKRLYFSIITLLNEETTSETALHLSALAYSLQGTQWRRTTENV